MNTETLHIAKVFDGQRIVEQQTLCIEAGIIRSMSDFQESQSQLREGLLVPGFIDVQVNGGGGCLFNHAPSVPTIQKIAFAHQEFGTTNWLPTLISDSLPKMQLAADAVADAIKQPQLGVLGIHFEGPHLSQTKKGVHSSDYLRPLSKKEMAIFQRSDLGQVVVTVAPEIVSPESIRRLVSSGVIVCLGHSDASYETVMTAIEAGATGFTHLFNAMSQFNSREPGMVGAALTAKNCFSGLIVDGLHVHTAAARLAIQSQPKVMLVSDSMALTGSKTTQFELYDETIYRAHNRLQNAQGQLAGTTLDMASAVRNCVNLLGTELPHALQMASLIPAEFLGISNLSGRLAVGSAANMTLLNQQLEVQSCWLNGELVFSK